ncbi:arginine deiminase family protein [Candidatus Frankia nodulisporulans]|uniref:arginine deiminase family protein n=1 Tax=Candidatus Frankia nodulisporulans TaxID=2060052 RepID=UPI0021F08C17|nr:arginine deiminase family protein [Candidatus Frankia nodulisporulans]
MNGSVAPPAPTVPMVLVQSPTVVQPVETFVFRAGRPAYDPVRAAAESATARAVLVELGVEPRSPAELLMTLPRSVLLELAARAVSADDDARLLAARDALRDWSVPALAPVVLRQPRLLVEAGAGGGVIGPRSGAGAERRDESYALRPLSGLMFPRDHYVDLGGAVAVGRLRRRERARETVVMAAVLRGLRGRSAEVRVPAPLYLAGGDVVTCGGVAILATGARTSPAVWGLLRPYLRASFTHVVRVRDELRRPAEPHLDHWLGLGPGIALVAADRLNAPAVVESRVVERPDPSGYGAADRGGGYRDPGYPGSGYADSGYASGGYASVGYEDVGYEGGGYEVGGHWGAGNGRAGFGGGEGSVDREKAGSEYGTEGLGGPDGVGIVGRETTLVDALRSIDLAVCPLAPEMVAAFAAGVFFLPAARLAAVGDEPAALVSTASAPWTEPVLARFGVHTIAVPFDEHHKHFGSLHRALNTVPEPRIPMPRQ